jgi:hypothetical protein
MKYPFGSPHSFITESTIHIDFSEKNNHCICADYIQRKHWQRQKEADRNATWEAFHPLFDLDFIHSLFAKH